MSRKAKINQNPSEEISTVIIILNEDPYFNLITNNEPKCLFPLVNVPLIYYTMLSLINAKFKNFQIFCGLHTQKVKDFFKDINFNDYVDGKCKIEFIEGNIKTFADSMIFLDKTKTDKHFLLVYGDLITDINYKKIINEFQIQKNKNPDIVMAQILSTNLNEELKNYSKTSNRLLVNKDDFTLISLGDEPVSKSQSPVILDKMYDPQIYICSNQIPLYFASHCDCLTMDDLISDILSQSAVIHYKIQIIPVSNPCYRINNLSTYSYVSRRLMHNDIDGLSPPFIFGDNIIPYDHYRSFTTWDNMCYYNRKLPRNFLPSSSKLLGNCQIQNYSKIGTNCRLENCVIGYKCQIGNNVTLRNCTIHSEVTIGNNSTILDSFVSPYATIGANCFISQKSIILNNCHVPADTRIEGKVFSNSDSIRDTFWTDPLVVKHEQEDKKRYDSDDEEPDKELFSHESDNEKNPDEKQFYHDLLKLVRESYKSNVSIDNIFLEINRLKHEYVLNGDQVCFQMMEVFIDFTLATSTHSQPTRTFRENFVDLLERFGNLLIKITEGNNRHEKIILCLEAVEEMACSNPLIMEKLLDVFYSLYDQDLVEEDDIVFWFEKSTLLKDQELKHKTEQARQNLSKLMTYFEEAEEESD